jgi:hypothetical protein
VLSHRGVATCTAQGDHEEDIKAIVAQPDSEAQAAAPVRLRARRYATPVNIVGGSALTKPKGKAQLLVYILSA